MAGLEGPAAAGGRLGESLARIEPYGNWESPISAASVARSGGRPDWPGWVGEEIWWTEPRPAEGGRVTLMRLRGGSGADPGTAEEVLAAPWNVRNRVIEYGGRPWAAVPLPGEPGGPLLVFTSFSDQRLYRYRPGLPGSEPEPLSPVPEYPAGMRFADFFIHPSREEAWGVRETFTGPAPTDVRRDIVAVPLDGSAAADPARIRVLADSHHFLTGPRLSPDGAHLCWIGWNHPAMPWDETELCTAEIRDGTPGTPCVLAGGRGETAGRPVSESVVQAEWLDEQTLVYVSDPGGWWNLYRLRLEDPGPEPLCQREEEFGGAMWRLGYTWFVPMPGGRIAAVHGRDSTRLSILDTGGPDRGTDTGRAGAGPGRELAEPAETLRTVGSQYTEWASCLASSGRWIAAVAASPDRPFELVRVDAGGGEVTVLRSMPHDQVDPGFLPRPQARTFRGEDGREIHACVYQPRNPRFSGPRGEPPPFAVFVHGGPTGRSLMVYDLGIAYFTSRGIGVVQVNYGGSTGHGRAYRERLRENWGVVDVADCASVARALAAEGTADGDRLVIRGGSAGGWTTAASLTSTDVYAGGVIYYPILDLSGWRTGETHDFESQYLESLVGPWPQASDRYRDRSPVNRADRLRVPFLLLQGLEDAICPPVQCERFLQRIAGRGIPHAYLTFEGEQHGFRKAETVTAALEAELAFLGQVLAFEPCAVPEIELDT